MDDEFLWSALTMDPCPRFAAAKAAIIVGARPDAYTLLHGISIPRPGLPEGLLLVPGPHAVANDQKGRHAAPYSENREPWFVESDKKGHYDDKYAHYDGLHVGRHGTLLYEIVYFWPAHHPL